MSPVSERNGNHLKDLSRQRNSPNADEQRTMEGERRAAGRYPCCTDPHVRDHALHISLQDPPPGLSPEAAAAEVREVLDSIGDTCPKCPT
jgi:hypothetical protein